MTIAKGSIKSQRDQREYPYEIERLKPEDLEVIMALQHLIVKENDGQETYRVMKREEVMADLKGEGVVVGLRIAGVLKGYFMIHYIRQDDPDIRFGIDIPMPEPYPANVCRFRHVGIHPDFRGSSLAKEMSRVVMQIAGEAGENIRYMCTVVAPNNYPSLNHQFNNRMMAVSLRKYHGGYDRMIMFQDFRAPITVADGERRSIPGSHLEEIRTAFREGFVGYDLKRTDGETHILFARPLQRLWMKKGDLS